MRFTRLHYVYRVSTMFPCMDSDTFPWGSQRASPAIIAKQSKPVPRQNIVILAQELRMKRSKSMTIYYIFTMFLLCLLGFRAGRHGFLMGVFCRHNKSKRNLA